MSRPNSGVGRIEQLVLSRPPDAERSPPIPSFEEGRSSVPNAGTLDAILSTIRQLETRMDDTDCRFEFIRPPPLPDPGPPQGPPGFRHPDHIPSPDHAAVPGINQHYSFVGNHSPIRPTTRSDILLNRSTTHIPDTYTQPPLHYPNSNRQHSQYDWNHPHFGCNSTAANHHFGSTSLRHQSSWDLPNTQNSIGTPFYDQHSGRQPSCWDLPSNRPQQGHQGL